MQNVCGIPIVPFQLVNISYDMAVKICIEAHYGLVLGALLNYLLICNPAYNFYAQKTNYITVLPLKLYFRIYILEAMIAQSVEC